MSTKRDYVPMSAIRDYVPKSRYLIEPFHAIEMPAYSETGHAERDIESIALHAFVDTYNYKYGPSCSSDLKIKEKVERQIIVSADAKINRIMRALSPRQGIDSEVSSKIIDYAIWGLVAMVSTLKDSTGDKGWTAGGVMKDLLYPLKCDTMRYDGNSLLYKTVRESGLRLGVGLLEAVLSRNDQRFRAMELEDKDVIELFESRYDTKIDDNLNFKANMNQPPLLYDRYYLS